MTNLSGVSNRQIARLCYSGLIALALIEAVAPLFYTDAPHFAFENWPAWGSIYGLVSCAAIVIVSKLLGKVWLTRRENYYDR